MSNPTPAVIRSESTSAGKTLEFARVLADRDGTTFRSDGTCMYPTIRPGDRLRIQSRPAREVQVGDIAVCRRSNHLFSHRVVAAGSDQGRAFVVTRPDRVLDRDDPPTFDDHLLGIVTAIERRGRSVPLVPAAPSWPARLWYALCLKGIEWRLRADLWGSAYWTRLQETRLYQRLAKAWFRMKRPGISFGVRVPMPALGDDVFRSMKPEEFNAEKDWRGRPVRRWTLTLSLCGESQPTAWMTFARRDADRWIVAQTFVRPRYRGAGLEEMLLARADDLLPPGQGQDRKSRWAKPEGDFSDDVPGSPVREPI
jgi:GNAT superfamily N-acetyltransferase